MKDLKVEGKRKPRAKKAKASNSSQLESSPVPSSSKPMTKFPTPSPETRRLRRRAGFEGHMERCESLVKIGVDPADHFRATFPSNKKSLPIRPNQPNLATTLLNVADIDLIDADALPYPYDLITKFHQTPGRVVKKKIVIPLPSTPPNGEEYESPKKGEGTPSNEHPKAASTPIVYKTYPIADRRLECFQPAKPRDPTRPESPIEVAAPRFLHTPKTPAIPEMGDFLIPPEEKMQILKGVVAFVHVFEEREGKKRKTDLSECVRIQLRAMGAEITKTFCKKVTHLLFRYGYKSYYWKAVVNKIPIVSTDWIEACKYARCCVDAKYYRPKHLEKYDDIPPHLLSTRRSMLRLRDKLKANSSLKVNGENNPPKTINCQKRLDFVSTDDQLSSPTVPSLEEVPMKDRRKRRQRAPTTFPINSNEDALDTTDKHDDVCRQKRKRQLFYNNNSIVAVPSSKEESVLYESNLNDVSSINKENLSKTNETSLLDDQLSIAPSYYDFATPKPVSKLATRRSLVVTGCPKSKLPEVIALVEKLGGFNVESSVSKMTSHVLMCQNKRTMNVLRGILRGCWIINEEWLKSSEEAGKWLSEELFEVRAGNSDSMNPRLERRAFGSQFSMQLFSSCGKFFVTRSTEKKSTYLKELLKLGKGIVVQKSAEADIIIGSHRSRTKGKEGSIRVIESWIAESIFNNSLLPFDNFLL